LRCGSVSSRSEGYMLRLIVTFAYLLIASYKYESQLYMGACFKIEEYYGKSICIHMPKAVVYAWSRP